MTVSTEEIEHLVDGNGASTHFTYPYRFDAAADIRCEIIAADGSRRVPDFTVSGTGSGATIILDTPPSGAETLAIWRDTALRQEINYEAGDFPSGIHEQSADRLVMMAQERREVERRSLRMARGTPPIPEIAAFSEPGRALVSSADGGFEEGPSAEEIREAKSRAEALKSAMMIPISEDETSVLVSIGNLYFVSESDTPYPSITLEAV